MREILFKAKRKDNGEWVEGYYRADPDLDTHYICGWNYYASENGLEREPFEEEINPDTLCQYTGLTDKNGEKIWENDILVEKHKGIVTMKYRVVFDLEEGAWMLETKSGARYGIGAVNQRHFEVCGNIFDNADLLEVK
jgi:uncharacterized phage protein (TIGR01671 family)